MLTNEQIDRALNLGGIRYLRVNQTVRDAYRLGVAAERKRVMAVLSRMIDGDSPGDRAITEAMNQIDATDPPSVAL